jgi:hypothetical protein
LAICSPDGARLLGAHAIQVSCSMSSVSAALPSML